MSYNTCLHIIVIIEQIKNKFNIYVEWLNERHEQNNSNACWAYMK